MVLATGRSFACGTIRAGRSPDSSFTRSGGLRPSSRIKKDVPLGPLAVSAKSQDRVKLFREAHHAPKESFVGLAAGGGYARRIRRIARSTSSAEGRRVGVDARRAAARRGTEGRRSSAEACVEARNGGGRYWRGIRPVFEAFRQGCGAVGRGLCSRYSARPAQ